MTVTKQKASKSLRLSLARQLPVALATVPKNYNSNKHFASALDLNLRALFYCFVALSINRRHMTKRIILALSFLLLGSLACIMQSAPSTPTQPTNQPKALTLATATASTELTCKVNTHALNVRDCAGIDCSIIGWLEDGWTVQAELSSGSSWTYITRGNLSGFARADYLTCK